jgi:hypothetical protein|tara:strand:+ start:208 stop:900 length:693 start_codon:yes stop_codon:yes gene_type:complete
VEEDKFTPDTLREFRKKNWELLSQEGNHVGIWKSNGRWYMDVSRVGKPSVEIIEEAQKASQLAIYDLEEGTEIVIGTIKDKEYNPIDEATNIFDRYQGQIGRPSGGGGDGSVPKVPEGVSASKKKGRRKTKETTVSGRDLLKAILAIAGESYEATVYVDGMQRTEQRAFAAGLRKLHVQIRLVRGLTDQADEFIRLADAVAGFLRDAMEGDEDMKKLYSRALKNSIINKD